MCPRQPRTKYAIPPHDRARDEHHSGSQAEHRPDRLSRLVADSGAVARNSDAVDAAEMQVGEPINDAVADPHPGVGGGGGLDLVYQILKGLRECEIHTAQAEYERVSKTPESDHAVQVPEQSLPPDAARQREAPAPGLFAGPPDEEAAHRHHKHRDSAEAVHGAAGHSLQQVVMKVQQTRYQPHAKRNRIA